MTGELAVGYLSHGHREGLKIFKQKEIASQFAGEIFAAIRSVSFNSMTRADCAFRLVEEAPDKRVGPMAERHGRL